MTAVSRHAGKRTGKNRESCGNHERYRHCIRQKQGERESMPLDKNLRRQVLFCTEAVTPDKRESGELLPVKNYIRSTDY